MLEEWACGEALPSPALTRARGAARSRLEGLEVERRKARLAPETWTWGRKGKGTKVPSETSRFNVYAVVWRPVFHFSLYSDLKKIFCSENTTGKQAVICVDKDSSIF